MRRISIFLLAASACATNGKNGVDHGASPEPLWSSATTIKTYCTEGLTNVRNIRDEVKASSDRTVAGTLEKYNGLMLEIDRVAGAMSLMGAVHPAKEIRTEAETCERDLQKLVSELALDRDLFQALQAVDVSKADPETQRFAEKLLRSFRRSGIDKDDATRAELKKIYEETVEVIQTFDRIIREDVRQIEVDPADLEGLPEDFVKAHPVNDKGKVVLTTNYPDFFPVQQYAKKEEVRKALMIESVKRGYPENDKNLKRLLELRKQYATVLGYPSWAEYEAEIKMVKSAANVEKFIEEVAAISRPRMERDLEALRARKLQDSKDGTIQLWDRFYYTELVKKEKYGFDAQDVRQYFDYNRVTDGLLALYGELFAVQFERDDSQPVWHESVRAYTMSAGGELIGRFYLDMHPRDGKYGHAAMFSMQPGIAGGQIPVASLVCNFPDPSTGGGKALMDHGEVVTYFHEFGHLVHQLLARGSKWSNLAGINTEWDFVEAPSQLLEEWAWDPAVLARFATHIETNEPIPADTVKKMKASSEFGRGVHLMRQIHFTALSHYLHSQDPAQLGELAEFSKRMQNQYSPYPHVDGTYLYASFGHLSGYSSAYYTYQWSLTLAKDIFTRFETAGLLDAPTAQAYRQTVLMPGGTKDAAQLVQDFLGRPTNLDAYKRWLQSE